MRHDRLVAARNDAARRLASADERSAELSEALDSANIDLVETESALRLARPSRRRADDDASRWRARADALAQALDAVRSRAGVETLSGTEGVLGTLLDRIAIADGWEGAVEAAAADALEAVLVDSEAAAGRRWPP